MTDAKWRYFAAEIRGLRNLRSPAPLQTRPKRSDSAALQNLEEELKQTSAADKVGLLYG
jgi:hypothetical protein